ncbi:MAG: rRNA adenine N-6-methyltransferase family protein, partial [Candidatus Thalassarchaeaceae archaeon]|nr:rRNA adenine N-6-methyltransferase family protein [Candidatus Thalassarchaeaceae archaeon]
MLGQNFLIDNNIAHKIVELSSIKKNEDILEIGPGRGALTELLVEKGNLLAVEKDKWLAVVLKQKFGKRAQII